MFFKFLNNGNNNTLIVLSNVVGVDVLVDGIAVDLVAAGNLIVVRVAGVVVDDCVVLLVGEIV